MPYVLRHKVFAIMRLCHNDRVFAGEGRSVGHPCWGRLVVSGSGFRGSKTCVAAGPVKLELSMGMSVRV